MSNLTGRFFQALCASQNAQTLREPNLHKLWVGGQQKSCFTTVVQTTVRTWSKNEKVNCESYLNQKSCLNQTSFSKFLHFGKVKILLKSKIL